MTPDATATADASAAEVMASVDTDSDGHRLVIADLTSDDAWLSVRLADAPALDDWR